jgi:predicted GIY-YIG superfamily endonuclease
MKSWFVYIVKCVDASLYTGITNDIERRINAHNNDNRTASAYTRSRRPVELVYQESYQTRSQASKREYQIKQLSRKEKIALLNTNN